MPFSSAARRFASFEVVAGGPIWRSVGHGNVARNTCVPWSRSDGHRPLCGWISPLDWWKRDEWSSLLANRVCEKGPLDADVDILCPPHPWLFIWSGPDVRQAAGPDRVGQVGLHGTGRSVLLRGSCATIWTQ